MRTVRPPMSVTMVELVHVEAERVEALDALRHAPTLADRELLDAGQLAPQVLVATRHLGGELDRVEVLVQHASGLQVHELTGDVEVRRLDVVLALAVAERRVQVAGLGVDEVGGEGAGVAPKEGVRQGAVVPDEAGEVQASDERDEGVEQTVDGVGTQVAGEHRAVRQRPRQVLGDQDGVQRRAVRRLASRHDTDRDDGGHVGALEVAQQPVLAQGVGLDDLLERVHLRVDPDEAHDVARDAPWERNEVPGGPLLQRHVPGQVDQRGLLVGVGLDGELHRNLQVLRTPTAPDFSAKPAPSSVW